MNIKPTTDELRDWLVSSLKHSMQVEYYLGKLDLGRNDPERPHDISGRYSKFTWDVAKGLALQYRDESSEFFNKFVLPAIELHRRQFHHRMWNRDVPYARAEDMKVGAVDSLCSLLDDRKYQGGSHTFEEILPIIKSKEQYKHKWFYMVYSQMKNLPAPDLSQVTSLEDIPDIGLPERIQDLTINCAGSALDRFRLKHDYKDL